MKLGVHLFYILYNRLMFRIKGIKYGGGLKIMNKVYVNKSAKSTVIIGKHFVFTSGGGYNPITSNVRGYMRIDNAASLTIGNNCGMSSSVLWVKEKMSFGNNVLVGGGCLIMDNDCHSLDYRHRNGSLLGDNNEKIDVLNANTSPVIIEDDVFIGARSIVLKGVTIGARSIIGAGSVVSQSIPADCIAAGNPCRVIKKIGYNEKNVIRA